MGNTQIFQRHFSFIGAGYTSTNNATEKNIAVNIIGPGFNHLKRGDRPQTSESDTSIDLFQSHVC